MEDQGWRIVMITALNRYFPCCGQIARFKEEECDGRDVERTCSRCGRVFIVSREIGRIRTRARIDSLTWVELTTRKQQYEDQIQDGGVNRTDVRG